jgi:hypothetical protein
MGETPRPGQSDNQIKQRARCFIMQPFGKRNDPKTGDMLDNDKVYEALRSLERIRPSFPIEVYRANTQKYSKDELHANVIDCLLSADFCVADFSGQNSNVLYETGYARGLNREVIVICRDRSDVPTDLKGLITVPYSYDDVGHLANDIDQHLDRVEAAVKELRAKTVSQVRYFNKRNDIFIQESIHSAKKRIYILQTNLSVIEANYITELLNAMRDNVNLELRILTLDPQSIFVNFRGQQLGFKENISLYRGELEAALKGVHFQLRKYGPRAQIRIYDDFPTQIGFYFDNEILACVVSATSRSRDNCAFLLSSSIPGAQKSFIEHFDYLWEDKNRKSVAYTPG